MQGQNEHNAEKNCARPIVAFSSCPITAGRSCKPTCLLAGIHKELSSALRAGLLCVEVQMGLQCVTSHKSNGRAASAVFAPTESRSSLL